VDLKVLSGVTPNDGIWKAIDSTGFATASGINNVIISDTFNGDTLNTLLTPRPAEGSNFTYMMRYFHDRSGCPTFRDTTLTIRGLPVPLIDHTDLMVNSLSEPYQICELNADIALTANYSGGTWYADNANALSGSTLSPSSVTDYNNPFYIHYDYSDIYGCTGTDSVQVEIHAKQTIQISNDTSLCRTGDNMTVDVKASITNATGLLWTPLSGGTMGSASALNTTFNFTSRTDSIQRYLLYISTDGFAGNVCPFVETTMQIFVHPKPIFNIIGDTLNGCNPVDVNFTTTITNFVDPGTSTYEWRYPGGNTDNVENPSVELKITSAFGCSDSMELNVEVYPIPVALFTPNPNNSTTAALPRFQFNNESTVDPVLGSTITQNIWDFGDLSDLDDTSTLQSPLFFYPADTGTYDVTLTVRTQYGCESVFTYPVIIGPDILVYIPNAFSPDGGGPGQNDGFRAVVNDGAKYYHLIIFNRWGEILWQTTDKQAEWDGNYGSDTYGNRGPAPQDVYAYYLKIISWNDKEFEYSGTVTLIR